MFISFVTNKHQIKMSHFSILGMVCARNSYQTIDITAFNNERMTHLRLINGKSMIASAVRRIETEIGNKKYFPSSRGKTCDSCHHIPLPNLLNWYVTIKIENDKIKKAFVLNFLNVPLRANRCNYKKLYDLSMKYLLLISNGCIDSWSHKIAPSSAIHSDTLHI